MQPNIAVKFAECVVWILLCMHCKFGEKMYYTSRDNKFFWRALYNTPDPTRGRPVTTTLGLYSSMHGLHGSHGFTGYVTIASLCTI